MSASVQVVLDTQPPTLTVTADRETYAPEHWAVLVNADEDLGLASAALLDAAGQISGLGVEHLGPRTFRVMVPTTEVSSGPGTLMLSVGDLVLNTTQMSVPVDVIRPEAYVVDFSLTAGFDVSLGIESAFDATLEIGPAYDAEIHITRAFDVLLDQHPAFAITLSISARAGAQP